ncbi:MAG: 6-carboxytetrahydropterin synthase QueD [Desulfobacterales bacterium]
MFELKIVTHFAAAHQLKMVAQKCENLHGHNWKIEVCLKGDTLTPAGILMDFGEVKKKVADIMARLDHRFLNDISPFNETYAPSSENIAFFIAGELQAQLADRPVAVSRVTAWESENACATYLPA